jgi:two-component system response regulator LytT
MLRIAICDDSQSDSAQLEHLCRACKGVCDMEISTFTDSDLFLSECQKKPYDIVFLDVEMPAKNGIDIGKQIRRADDKVVIIFFTSYPEYAIDAYDCEAFGYLLKPISCEKLEDTLGRAIHKLSLSRQYHTVKIHNVVRRIPISDIYYVEYCRKHIIYHTRDESIETTGRFSDVLNELDKYGFYQVHQGYIVNFDKVYDFDGYNVILDDKRSVMISVRKKKEVILAYTKYVENNL